MCCILKRLDDPFIVLDTLLVELLLPPIVGLVEFDIEVHGSCKCMSILHVELLENRGYEGLWPSLMPG
jgi:hypothetical protein